MQFGKCRCICQRSEIDTFCDSVFFGWTLSGPAESLPIARNHGVLEYANSEDGRGTI